MTVTIWVVMQFDPARISHELDTENSFEPIAAYGDEVSARRASDELNADEDKPDHVAYFAQEVPLHVAHIRT